MQGDDRFDVVLLGFAEGRDEPPAAGLERVFGMDAKAAAKLLARLPRTVQKNVPRVRAEYFRRALVLIGGSVEVRTRDGFVVDPEPVAPAVAVEPAAASPRKEPAPANAVVEPSAPAPTTAIVEPSAPMQLAHPAGDPPATSLAERTPATHTLAWGEAPVADATADTLDGPAPPAHVTLPEGVATAPAAAPGHDATRHAPVPPLAALGPQVGLPPAPAVPPLAALGPQVGLPPAPAVPRPAPAPASPGVAPARAPDATFHAPAPPPSPPVPAPPVLEGISLPPPDFGPSSRTVVDISRAGDQFAMDASAAPPSQPFGTFGLSLPPLSGLSFPPFERAAPPSKPAPPPGAIEGLDWLKLAAPFATHVESAPPSAAAPGARAPKPEDVFDRFEPLHPAALAPAAPQGVHEAKRPAPAAREGLRTGTTMGLPAPERTAPEPRVRTADKARAAPRDKPRAGDALAQKVEPVPVARAAAFQVPANTWQSIAVLAGGPPPASTGASAPNARDAAAAAPPSAPTGANAPHAPLTPARAARAPAAPPRVGLPVDTRSFWSTIAEGIALPFQGHGLYWILGVTIWSFAAGLLATAAGFFPLPMFGLIVSFVAQSSVLAFACDFFKVCMWAPATGDKAVDRSPELEPEKILYTNIASGMHLTCFALVSMIPLGFWTFKSLSFANLADPNILFGFALHPVTWLFALLPGVYWPMGVGLTALGNDFAAIWNVPLAFKGILRAPLAYAAIVLVGWLSFFASWLALTLFGSSMGLPGMLLQGSVGLPLAASHGMMGALLGHLVRAKPDLFD